MKRKEKGMKYSRMLLLINRILYVVGAAMLIAGFALTASASTVRADDPSNYCPNSGAWVFVYEVTPPTYTFTAADGMQITKYCVGDGLTPPAFSNNIPPSPSVTVGVPKGDLAHAAFKVEVIPGYGCMDVNAFNYDPMATVNGGCIAQCPWNGAIAEFDTACVEPQAVAGCMDSTAINYDPQATINDQSCLYPPEDEEENSGTVDPLEEPRSAVSASGVLIPVTGMKTTSGMNGLSYGGLGVLGLGLIMSGLRKKMEK
jgi:hypothetical protein